MTDQIANFAHAYQWQQFLGSSAFLDTGFVLVVIVVLSLTLGAALVAFFISLAVFSEKRSSIVAFCTMTVGVLTFVGTNVVADHLLLPNVLPNEIETLMSPGHSLTLDNIICEPFWPMGVKAVNREAAIARTQADNTPFCSLDISGTIIGTFSQYGVYHTFIKNGYGAIWQVPSFMILEQIPTSTIHSFKAKRSGEDAPDSQAMSNFEHYKSDVIEHRPGHTL